MADRSHVETSLPCETPGCAGFMKCHGGSKLIPFDGGIARKRLRVCERCSCKVETIEFKSRTVNVGYRRTADAIVLSTDRQRNLF